MKPTEYPKRQPVMQAIVAATKRLREDMVQSILRQPSTWKEALGECRRLECFISPCAIPTFLGCFSRVPHGDTTCKSVVEWRIRTFP